MENELTVWAYSSRRTLFVVWKGWELHIHHNGNISEGRFIKSYTNSGTQLDPSEVYQILYHWGMIRDNKLSLGIKNE